jgi:hypothetical protein
MGFFKIAGAGEECYHAVFSWEKFECCFRPISFVGSVLKLLTKDC